MKQEDVLLMMDLGTLIARVLSEKETSRIRDFKGGKLILTGWDFKGQGKKAAEKYNVNAIVCESSVLYIKAEGIYKKITPPLHTPEEIKFVKHANFEIMNRIYQVEPSSVLLSQANEEGVCYYINPHRTVKEKLEEFKSPEEVDAGSFKKRLIEDYRVNSNDIEIIDKMKLRIRDSIENRYYIEKINAKYRTFRPYHLEPKEEYIHVSLNPEQKVEWKPEEVNTILRNKIVQELWSDGLGTLSVHEYLRIAPQNDVCIDIFARTKREVWQEAIRKANLDKYPYVIYISKGTISDIPLIADGLSKKNFFALGPSDMPEGLKAAGIFPKADTISQAIEFIEALTPS